jgi:hypothetical protein
MEILSSFGTFEFNEEQETLVLEWENYWPWCS